MNFGNFNLNKDDLELPIHPDSLSKVAKGVVTVLASFLMAACGTCITFGFLSDDFSILLFAAIFSFFVYLAVSGMCALLVLEAPKLAPVPAVLSFLFVIGFFIITMGGFRVAFLFGALLSLFPFVAGLSLALAMKKGLGRTSAILVCAICSGIFVFFAFVVSFYLAGGTISGEALGSLVDQVRSELCSYFDSQLIWMKENFPQYNISDIDPVSLSNGIINLLPSTVALCFSSVAFFSNLSLLALLRIFDLYHKLSETDKIFKVSIVTAVVFALSYIMSVVLADADSTALAVFDNLSIILMPAMAVTGLMYCLPRRQGNMVKVGCFPLFISFSLIFTVPVLGMFVLAFFGTFYTIREAISAKKKDFYK